MVENTKLCICVSMCCFIFIIEKFFIFFDCYIDRNQYYIYFFILEDLNKRNKLESILRAKSLTIYDLSQLELVAINENCKIKDKNDQSLQDIQNKFLEKLHNNIGQNNRNINLTINNYVRILTYSTIKEEKKLQNIIFDSDDSELVLQKVNEDVFYFLIKINKTSVLNDFKIENYQKGNYESMVDELNSTKIPKDVQNEITNMNTKYNITLYNLLYDNYQNIESKENIEFIDKYKNFFVKFNQLLIPYDDKKIKIIELERKKDSEKIEYVGTYLTYNEEEIPHGKGFLLKNNDTKYTLYEIYYFFGVMIRLYYINEDKFYPKIKNIDGRDILCDLYEHVLVVPFTKRMFKVENFSRNDQEKNKISNEINQIDKASTSVVERKSIIQSVKDFFGFTSSTQNVEVNICDPNDATNALANRNDTPKKNNLKINMMRTEIEKQIKNDGLTIDVHDEDFTFKDIFCSDVNKFIPYLLKYMNYKNINFNILKFIIFSLKIK